MTEAPLGGANPVTAALNTRARMWAWLSALLPLVLLAGIVAVFLTTDGAGLKVEPAAPIEAVDFERIVLKPGEVFVHIRNSSPEPIRIATVTVNDAVVEATAYPADTVPRLGQAVIHVRAYHWVAGEPVKVTVLTANLIKFEHEVAAATTTPEPGWDTFWRFLLVGLYVGVVPVGLGMLWYPFLRRMGRSGVQFVLALTVGLLVFLAVDTLAEAFEFAAEVPGAFQGSMLVVGCTLLSLLGLIAVGSQPQKDQLEQDAGSRRLRLAFFIALGIGLHNLGEGLAIGAAYAAGEAALGAFLVVGFTLHNATEGVGIVAPLTQVRPRLPRFAALAVLAGAPAILGTWLGGFIVSPVLSTVFFALGAGAILQVIWQVGRLIWEQSTAHQEPALSWLNVGGLSAGLALMWLTALLVK